MFVKSTLFNFPNNYDAVMLSSVISVTVKTTDEHLVGRRFPWWSPLVVFWEAERHPKNHKRAPKGYILLVDCVCKCTEQ